MDVERWQDMDQGRLVNVFQAGRSAGCPTPPAKTKPCSTAGVPTVRLFLSSVSNTLRKEQSCRRSP